MLNLGLGTGDAVEAHGVQASLVNLVDAPGNDDRDISLGGPQVFDEVHSKRVHLSSQFLCCMCVILEGKRCQVVYKAVKTIFEQEGNQWNLSILDP